jgi:hypothetical protein
MNTCARCGFATNTRQNLKTHLLRKYKCSPVLCDISPEKLYEMHFNTNNKIKCSSPLCCSYFKLERTKKVHEKHCQYMAAYKLQLATEAEKEAAIIEEANKRIEIIQKERNDAKVEAKIIKLVEEKMQEKKEELVIKEKSPSEPAIVVTASTIQSQNAKTINNNTTNNTTTINITPFGVWKDGHMQHIISDHKFMMHCLSNAGVGMCNLLTKMHFDENHPENQNIRKMTKKELIIEQHNGNLWIDGNYMRTKQSMVNELEFVCLSFFNECANAEKPINIDDTVKRFMRAVGNVLDWDLDASDYECTLERDERSDAVLLNERKALIQMFVNCIYVKTRDLNVKKACK